MNDYTTKQIKNLVLLGSSNSGKTTFAEAMAYEGKEIDRLGSVEEGTTVSDFTEKEQQYKHSIYSSVLLTEFNEMKLNIIDAPGADDFCGGLFSAFKVVDVGVMLINAEEGFEAGTEVQARYARRHNKPVIAFINKLDSKNADWEMSIESLTANSKVKPVLVQYPLNPGENFDSFVDVLLMKCYKFDGKGGRVEMPIPDSEMEKAKELQNILVEAAAENDDKLMELFFEKGTLTEDEMRDGLKIGLSERTLIPVFCGSAKKLIGIKRLMEFTTRVAPGPLKAPHFNTQSGDKVEP
ncbi:MAG: GTP-binding protein, partial [Rikenellaceae bacterium]